MKKNDIAKCTAMIIAGVIAVIALLTDPNPANAILVIGLFAMIAFVL